MSAIGSLARRRWPELSWGAFAAANLAVIVALDRWETIPFHFIWVSLTLVYGLRVWRDRTTAVVLISVVLSTGTALLWTVAHGQERVDELAEVPLMAAMFGAMVWHARRRQAAVVRAKELAENEHGLLERQRDFVRDASHELRTPITVARGHTELILRQEAGRQAARDAEIVLDELDRLQRLSERLLILAAVEHPDLLHMSEVDLEGFVASLARRWRPAATRHWEFLAEARGVLVADGERLRYAIDALIENAVAVTDEDGSVCVRAREGDTPGIVAFDVSDSGTGIPPEHRERVFSRFARVDDHRGRVRDGTGLGLAIVKAIVQAHGGSVAVTDSSRNGSTLTIRVPGFRSVAVTGADGEDRRGLALIHPG